MAAHASVAAASVRSTLSHLYINDDNVTQALIEAQRNYEVSSRAIRV